MYKCAVVGDYDSIYAFAALGLDTFPVQNSGEAAEILHKLADGSYAVIYVTEAVIQAVPQAMERYAERITPAVIPIPGVSGNTGIGIANVKKSVEKAVGSDIIFNDESE